MRRAKRSKCKAAPQRRGEQKWCKSQEECFRSNENKISYAFRWRGSTGTKIN